MFDFAAALAIMEPKNSNWPLRAWIIMCKDFCNTLCFASMNYRDVLSTALLYCRGFISDLCEQGRFLEYGNPLKFLGYVAQVQVCLVDISA